MTATFTVGQRVEQYINLPCNALQTTLATYTGQNIGANKLDRVKKGARQGLLISLIITCIISLLIWIFASNIASLFGLSNESMNYCVDYIETIALINIILSMYVPLFGVFQGSGHSGFPAIVATCALTIRVLVVYLFRYSSFMGYTIIWWNGVFGYSVGFSVTWLYFLSGKWSNRN